MKFSAPILLSILCLLICNQSLATGKVYKWTDDKGVTHYGQTPPADTQKEVLKIKTTHSDATSSSTAASIPTQKPAETKKMDQADKPVSNKNPENCDAARKNIDILKTHARIKTKGDDGEYHYLTTEEQQQKIDEANKAVEMSCE